jgi:hypothetical protein
MGKILPVASLTRNDSSVTGTTVKDALETLKADFDGIDLSGFGNVSVDSPTTEMTVPAWSSTNKKLRNSTGVKIHSDASDKFETVASFRAVGAASDGATITFDLNTADFWTVTLGGNRTLAVSHVSVGQLIAIRLKQDATGGRTVTWWSGILWNHSLAPVLDPTAGGTDLIVLLCVGLDGYGAPIWEEVCRKSSAPRKEIYANTDGATITFDLRKSPMHKVTLGGNRTLAVVESHSSQLFTVRITTAGHTVIWWSGITWAGGSAPTLSASGTDVFGFVQTASGAYDGFVIGQGL